MRKFLLIGLLILCAISAGAQNSSVKRLESQRAQLEKDIELLNRIFAFVREYNADNQQFDIILRKTFNDSPTLYMNPAMDITDEIIEGLNNEYKTVKAKKKAGK